MLASPRKHAPPDCEVIRLTIDDDLTTREGLEKAISAVSVDGLPTLLLGSLPCVGGSPYQYMNWKLGPSTRRKIRNHRAVFRVLWHNFMTVADVCRAHGGKIAIEWPRPCMYWRDRSVKAFLHRMGLKHYNFDGCMFNLRSIQKATKGQYLKKPWRIASGCDEFHRIALTCHHCGCPHARIQGQYTKMTENYTDELVDSLHMRWAVTSA